MCLCFSLEFAAPASNTHKIIFDHMCPPSCLLLLGYSLLTAAAPADRPQLECYQEPFCNALKVRAALVKSYLMPQQQDLGCRVAAPAVVTVISLHRPPESTPGLLCLPEIQALTKHVVNPGCELSGSNSTHSVTNWACLLVHPCPAAPTRTSLLPACHPANLPCTGPPVAPV